MRHVERNRDNNWEHVCLLSDPESDENRNNESEPTTASGPGGFNDIHRSEVCLIRSLCMIFYTEVNRPSDASPGGLVNRC